MERRTGFEPVCVQLPFASFVARGDTGALCLTLRLEVVLFKELKLDS